MSLRTAACVSLVSLGLAAPLLTQQASTTQRIPQLENEQVKVWKSIIAPNQPLSMHRHEAGRVIVALKGGTLKIVQKTGESKGVQWETGKATAGLRSSRHHARRRQPGQGADRGDRRRAEAALSPVSRLVIGALALLAAGQPSAPPRTLVWSDEFNGPSGARVDASRWVSETGGHGWGNHELQYYTERAANASLDGRGNLVIQALRERFESGGVAREYTSARLKTQGLFEQAYGRFEARIQCRAAGHLAGVLAVGRRHQGRRMAALRRDRRDGEHRQGAERRARHAARSRLLRRRRLERRVHAPGGAAFADDFHVFAVEWEPERVRFFVDDTLYHTRSRSDLKPEQPWVFGHPFFILLNVAVGGDWPGGPDQTTVFPQAMRVDYVRVYR
jgi:hypothetical protein